MPSKRVVEPEVRAGSHDSTVQSHPAYGQIVANRVSSTGHVLYDSDFKHQHFVTIAISRSELHRSLSRDWHQARDELISVAMSEAQWASFVSSMNQGGGVCCTIEHIDRKQMPDLPRPKSRHEQFKGEYRERIGRIVSDAKKLAELIEKGGRKTEMRDLVSSVTVGLDSNLSFLAEQFGEFMETTTEKAKVEINAYATATLQRTGLEALGVKPPIALPQAKEKP